MQTNRDGQPPHDETAAGTAPVSHDGVETLHGDGTPETADLELPAHGDDAPEIERRAK